MEKILMNKSILKNILYLGLGFTSLIPYNLIAQSPYKSSLPRRTNVDMRRRNSQELSAWRPHYTSTDAFVKRLATSAPKFRDEIKRQRAQIEPEDPHVVKSGYYRFGTLASNVLDFAPETIIGGAGLYLAKDSIDNMSKIPVPTSGWRISDPEFRSHFIFLGIGIALIAAGPIRMGAKKFWRWANSQKETE